MWAQVDVLTVNILLTCVAQAHGRELVANNVADARASIDKLVNKLVDILANQTVLPTGSETPMQQLTLNATKGPVLTLVKDGDALVAKAKNDSSPVRRLLETKRVGEFLSIGGNVFNLIQNCIGSGVLSLSAGIATIGGDPKLVLPGTIIATMMGILSAYTFFLIGQQCGIQHVSTYMNAWSKSVGERSAWAVTAITLVDPSLACLSYSIIVGDTFSSLARGGFLGQLLSSSSIARDRRTWILGFTAFVFYPLCSFKKLEALACTSMLGTLAVVYTGAFTLLRYLDGSYLPGGRYHNTLSVRPSLGTGKGNFLSAFKSYLRPRTVVLLCLLSTAYNAHTNAPAYFDEAGHDVAKFGLIVSLGFGFTLLLSLVFLVSGFLTFGSSSAGVILNSYAKTDRLAAVARALFGLSVVFDYPVLFAGIKQSLLSILSRFTKVEDTILLNQAMTVLPLAAITLTSVVISNAGVVNAICGAITGSTLIYIFPTLMYLLGSLPNATNSTTVKNLQENVKNPIEKFGNYVLLVFGSLMGVIGIGTSWKLH